MCIREPMGATRCYEYNVAFRSRKSSVLRHPSTEIRLFLCSRFTPGLMHTLRPSYQVRGGHYPHTFIQLNSNISPPSSPLLLAHVSRDGRDLVIMTTRNQVFLVRDFERIWRGETSVETSGQVLHLSGQAKCFYLAFENGHVCVATVRIFNSTLARVARTHSLSFFFLRLFLVSWTLHNRSRQRSRRLERLDKSLVRATFLRPCSCALARH
jgi:hypothetical protein